MPKTPTYEELERKVQELELIKREFLQREELYKLAIDATEEGIWDFDPRTGKAFFSPRWLTMLGYSPGELPATYETWVNLMHPDDRFKAETAVKEFLKKPENLFDIEFRMRSKKGGWCWVYSRGKAFERDSEGKISRMVGTHVDITERRRLEDTLRLTQFSFDKASMGIYWIGSDAQILKVNEQAAQNIGYHEKELTSMTVFDIDPLVNDDNWEAIWQRIIDGELYRFETIHRKKDGIEVPVEITSNLLEYNGRQFSVAFVQDITDRKRATRALHVAKHCIEKALIGIYEIDAEGQIVNVNEKACQSLGYSREELCNMSLFDIDPIFPREKWKEHRNYLRVQGTKTIESIHQRKDGTTFPVEILINFHEYEGEEFSMSFVTDITDRKKAEKEREILHKQLVYAQKMEAVGQLAGGIAHDFNNIIQTIVGNAQLLLLEWDQKLKGYNRLQNIEKASLRASKLITQLLTYSRKIESDLKPTNLNNKIKQIADILNDTIPKMVSIELLLGDDLYDINADSTQIDQIIMNLSINAMHAMPEGGKLNIETHNATLDQEFCNTHLGATAGNYAMLTVSDNGIGMDQATLNRIYDPFFTTKKTGEGTGLGLSMVYGIVKSHCGYIMCYSEVGKGTEFKIYFPAIDVKEENFDKGATFEEIRRGTERILVVDDDQDITEFAEKALSMKGYTPLVARTGEEALALYEAKMESIELIILDLNMPGMGGHKCLSELIKINPSVKVLIASGYSQNGTADKTMNAGARGFIEKPFQIVELLRKIREILETD